MITATMSVRAKKMPSRVSSVFLITFLSVYSGELRFEINSQKFLHERVGAAPHFLGGPEGENVSFVHDRDAIGHAKSQITIVRHDNRRDLDALLEVQDLLANRYGRERIEFTRRLIVENELRLDDKRPR